MHCVNTYVFFLTLLIFKKGEERFIKEQNYSFTAGISVFHGGFLFSGLFFFFHYFCLFFFSFSPCFVWELKQETEGVDTVQALFSIAKTLMCYQHCFNQNLTHSTVWAAVKKLDSISARPSTLENPRPIGSLTCKRRVFNPEES